MKYKVSLNGNAQSIYKKIENIVMKMIVKITKMKKINYKKSIGKSSYFKRRNSEESNLEIFKFSNFSKIYDFIRMLDADDYPRAFLKIGDKKITFSNAKISKKTINGNFKIQKIYKCKLEKE